MHDAERERLIAYIRESVIGADETIAGPFGRRRITYADYVASGRALSFIESYICREVLPTYANTHTETSGTGLQTTHFREEAREIVRRAVNATEEDAVIFCGAGATAAVDKLVRILNLDIPHDLDASYGLSEQIPDVERPIVFVGPYEHHSNELPWRESIAEVVAIDLDADGGIDTGHLEKELSRHAERALKIGSFSAASNVTGLLSDVDAVTTLLHRHGALAFWDYACAAPYVSIDMGSGSTSKDAIFLSPHKFIGGPGCPGVLVVKKELCTNSVPAVPGGGTVSWVSDWDHRYVEEIERREEGGTPDIIGSIRTGLVWQLKEAVGASYIRRREQELFERCLEQWRDHPNIEILGNTEHERLSVVSFVIRHGNRMLHWNFVVLLLNDLFGIQARGGCSCAGPYGHRLLGIEHETSVEYEKIVESGYEAIRPGWVRLSFNYFISDAETDFLIDAVKFVADQGWKLLPHYELDTCSGMWRHRGGPSEQPIRLQDIAYASGRMEYPAVHEVVEESVLASYLEEAGRIVEESVRRWQEVILQDPDMPDHYHRLRWFPLPGEVLAELRR
jgi:selenocysteine lyase/cysteine desulfurase